MGSKSANLKQLLMTDNLLQLVRLRKRMAGITWLAVHKALHDNCPAVTTSRYKLAFLVQVEMQLSGRQLC